MKIKTVIVISLGVMLQTSPVTAETSDSSPNWMSGHWCGKQNGNHIEEMWLTAHGDVMIGTGRTLSGDRTSNFEYMRIITKDGRTQFIAQPGGQPPVAFLKTAGGANWIRFENTAHDFPQRIEYRRAGNALQASITGPGEHGTDFTLSFEYSSCQE